MQNSVAVLDDNHVQGSADAPQVWYERTPSEEAVFHGEDELGRTGWFLRLEVTGLFPRRCGPFASREEAVGTLDRFLSDLVPGVLCELGNELDHGACVVEGFQPVTTTANEG